jgi:hypothetical protein
MQLALAKIDSRVTSSLSPEALEQYTNENPEGLQELDENTKMELAEKRELFQFLDGSCPY